MATGIGSVPFLDVDETCEHILRICPHIPFWPQFVKRSALEDMSIQASQGIPLLALNHEKKVLLINPSANSETELVSFYEHFLASDLDHFAITTDYAAGLYKLLELIERNPKSSGPFIKGQIVGPITFAGAVRDSRGSSALSNGELMDTIVKGLAIKALWLIKKMSVSGRRVILFIDEPFLSGFGSAFTPLQREEVVRLIGEMVSYLHSRSDALIGIHCCGNTDWSMIIETGTDIVNFDAFDYMDYFLLYRDEIVEFLKNGGVIAWGVVPTTSFTGRETLGELRAQLQKGLNRLQEWGIKKAKVAERCLLTPACGVGSLEPEKAERILDLLCRLSASVFDLAA
jgi:hypothetical protein